MGFKTSYSFSRVTNCHARVTAVLIRPGRLSAAPPRLLAETGGRKKKNREGTQVQDNSLACLLCNTDREEMHVSPPWDQLTF